MINRSEELAELPDKFFHSMGDIILAEIVPKLSMAPEQECTPEQLAERQRLILKEAGGDMELYGLLLKRATLRDSMGEIASVHSKTPSQASIAIGAIQRQGEANDTLIADRITHLDQIGWPDQP